MKVFLFQDGFRDILETPAHLWSEGAVTLSIIHRFPELHAMQMAVLFRSGVIAVGESSF